MRPFMSMFPDTKTNRDGRYQRGVKPGQSKAGVFL
jgi:hypothetical protein